jgi:hypothetical protein
VRRDDLLLFGLFFFFVFGGGWFVSLNWFPVNFSMTINERRYRYPIFRPSTG